MNSQDTRAPDAREHQEFATDRTASVGGARSGTVTPWRFAMVGHVLILALISGLTFPSLLAITAVLLALPHPERLLAAAWVGGFTASVAGGLVVLAAFSDLHRVLGATGGRTSPGLTLAIGVLAVGLAALLGLPAGERLLHRLHAHLRRHPSGDESPELRWMERGSMLVAAGLTAGPSILPGPFYFVALGELAHHDRGTLANLVIVLLFNLVMFMFVEVPLVGYAIRPDATADAVTHVSAFLRRDGMRIVAIVLLAIGIGHISDGISAL